MALAAFRFFSSETAAERLIFSSLSAPGEALGAI